MPCFLRGRAIIRDIDRLRDIASQYNLTITEQGGMYHITQGETPVLSIATSELNSYLYSGNASTLLQKITREYNTRLVKLTAQRKGWRIGTIKEEKDRVIIRIRE